jgi:hypothetical protein
MTAKKRRRAPSITPERLDVQRRRRLVLTLIANGATYREAAQAVINEGMAPRPRRGPNDPRPTAQPRYTDRDANRDAHIAMAEITERPARDLKALMNHRLAQAERAMMRDLTTGRTPADRGRAASVLVRLLVREAHLNGLDEPVRTQLEITQHVEQLAALSTAAINAGADAAGLSNEQRAAMLSGMRGYLRGGSSDGGDFEMPALPGEVVEADVIDEETGT